jgi:diguanylate cyclase (GGDEF)-like protein
MKSSIMSLTANRRHRIAAYTVAAFIAAVAVGVLPAARTPAPAVPAFLPMFAVAAFATEGLTAYLLWTQFVISRHAFLAVLAGAYGYTAIAVMMHLLVFPGVFAPAGLLGTGVQGAVWIWAFWHCGTPLFVAAALAVQQRHPAPLPAPRTARIGALLTGTPIALALLLGYLAIRHQGWLPPLMDAQTGQRLPHGPRGIGIALVCAGALLYLVIRTRLRGVLELWLGVALLAGLADVVVSIVSNGRFSVGWYVSRVESVFASSTVLGVLIWEISHLYRELHAANARLSAVAERDGLTGLYNRRHFDEHYPAALAQAYHTQHPLSILMVDIDHFKVFNDTLGHLRGDDCLVAVAVALQTSLRRSGDFVARFGGEEFAVVLPDCDRETARSIGENLRAAVAQLAVPAPCGDSGHVTVSVGVATVNRLYPASAAELLAHADAALYCAKESGRDRVTTWPASPRRRVPMTLN